MSVALALAAGVCLAEDPFAAPYLTPRRPAAKGILRTAAANRVQRAPDYAAEDGTDWVYHHGFEAKRFPFEAVEDPGVDLFCVYPTTVKTNSNTTVDGFVDIDDERMRGPDSGIWFDLELLGRLFSDRVWVYAPFYRQATMEAQLNEAEEAVEDTPKYSTANQKVADFVYNGVAYQDVTNALEYYFTRLNNGRPFVLAGHSQGSALLRNVMEHYFTQDETHLNYLTNMIACYAVGYGVTKEWMANLEQATGGRVRLATGATDTGVYVTWNTEGPGGVGPNALVPSDSVSINPLTWTTNATPAGAELNIGAIDRKTRVITPGLYDAQVVADRGSLVCVNMPTDQYLPYPCFGTVSCHNQDYPAYFENIRANARERIAAALGKVIGSEDFPWAAGPDAYAWTNGVGGLLVTGSGMLTSAPWTDCAKDIDELWAGKGVTDLGKAMTTLLALESVNGLSMEAFGSVVVGAVKAAGFSAIAVNPVTGMVDLSFVVSRTDSLKEPDWKPVATNDVSVKAVAPSGFYVVAPQD